MDVSENHDAVTGEIIEAGSNVPAVVIDPMSALLAKIGATGVRQVTRAVLQQRDTPIAIKFIGAAYQGELLENGRGSGVKMAAARLAVVKNLETGEEMSLIMNTVLEEELNRAYGKPTVDEKSKDGLDGVGGYVAKSFLIRSFKRVDADGKEKRYRDYQIAELTFDGAETAANVASADKVADTAAAKKGK